MNYYLLEDNLIQQRRIQHIIANCLVFDQPMALLDALKADQSAKVILLDLEIRTVENVGLNVAKMIRQFDTMSQIIIVTTHSEMIEQGLKYHIGMIDFIDKAQSDSLFTKRLLSAITAAEQQIRMQNGTQSELIRLPNGQKSESLYLNDIVYMTSNQSQSHQLTVCCEQKSIQIRTTVKSLPDLHQNFIQIHAAYVVNKSKVSAFDAKKRTVQLHNGVLLPCARKYLKSTRQLFEI
ncbi:LytR/AlgR family response regulator transcription factor [Leuconostoc inhae]|uniref:LytR/AlgR family response regulator transcription factor n=1 Tax=Leuconostoc inhae TaxID=178001 RepID=UPI001C7D3260|nr:response regulator transcription factor [Leuconostoc inhae]